VVVVDPGTPRTPIWAPITDIKYVITDQYQEIASLRARLGLSDLLAKTLSESSATLRTAGGSCGSFINGLATWLIVKTDGSMVTLSADNSSPTITHSVSISATDAIAGLIQQQTNAMPPDILEQIKGELQQKFPTLGGAEIEWLIEEQVMQLANFTNSIKFSSDQRYPTLLFLLTEKTPNFQYTLYSVGLDSGIEQQISEGSVTKRPSFDFSPDGKQIVYDAYDRGENVIRIRNVDGTNDRIVARNGSGACWH